MESIYNIIIFLLSKLAHLFTPFSNKLGLFISGRKGQIKRIKKKIGIDDRVIWMHCASLGEYEQGRAVWRILRAEYKTYKFVLSFFSPSGYEALKDSEEADIFCYIPFDTQRDAKSFIRAMHPELAIFVKYEFWFNHLKTLNSFQVPTVFISTLVDKNYFLFNNLGKFIGEELKKVARIFVQNRQSKIIFKENGFSNISIAGDTRIDGVLELKDRSFNDDTIEKFCLGDKPVIVVGSSWEKDIDILAGLDKSYFNKYKWIIAPHEPCETQIRYMKNNLPFLEFSYYAEHKNEPKSNALILDKMGLLKQVYKYADLAYVGGGFGSGIHNTLEPAVHEIPVIFGPKYHKFYEAVTLVAEGGFFAVTSSLELERILIQLEDRGNYTKAVTAIEHFFNEQKGATTKIIDYFGMILDRDR